MLSRRVHRLERIEGHGKHIYAYCHVRTNQVLYSLERTLRNSHLKQLADVGANNNPPTLRKDVWRPLWTVSLPDSPEGARQGLELYKLLREYKYLHEISWEIPEEMSRPLTEKQIEAIQRDLDDRGGSKKESVYDLIKRQKHKIRVKMVMNQKANSIADLAAILLRQERSGATISRKREEILEERREHDINTIVLLAEKSQGTEIEELKASIPVLEAEVKRATQAAGNKDSTKKVRKAAFQTALHKRREIEGIQLRIDRMEWSAARVTEAKARAAPEQGAAETPGAQSAAASSSTADSIKSQAGGYTAGNATQAETKSANVVDFRQFLPEFPPELDPIAAAKAGISIPKNSALEPRGTEKRMAHILKKNIHTAQDIKVKWANILDAEFAETWPEGVKHDRLGFVRNTAPKPHDEPIDDVRQFKGKRATKADAERPVEDKAARAQRSAVLKSISERLIAKVSGPRQRPSGSRKAVEMRKEKCWIREVVQIPAQQETAGGSHFAELEAGEPPVQGDAPKL